MAASDGESRYLFASAHVASSNDEEAAGEERPVSPAGSNTSLRGIGDEEDDDVDVATEQSASASALQKALKRARYYIPVINWLPRYPLSLLSSDIVAGFSTSGLLLPQCIAYPALANLPPSYGLYSAFFPLIIYFVFGTSRELGVGPDALVSILTGQAVAPLVSPCTNSTDTPLESSMGDSSCEEQILAETIALSLVLAFYVGVLALTFGFFRLGYLDSVLSRATNRGFLTSVASIILIEQLPQFFGYTTKYDEAGVMTTVEKIEFLFDYGSEFNWTAFGIGTTTLVIVYLHRFLSGYVKRPKIVVLLLKFTPVLLLTVIFMTVISWGFHLDEGENGLVIIGEVNLGYVTPAIPRFEAETFSGLLIQAFVICICGFIQAIVVAKEFANRFLYSVSDNRELVAFGLQNIVGSFFGAYPTFASPPRTVINSNAGARSPVALLVTAIVMMLVTLFLIEWFYYLPKCVAAAIVITAAFGLIQVDDILFLYRIHAWKDLLLMALTFSLTLFLGISVGVFVSLLLSLALVVKESTKPTFITLLGRYRDTNKFRDVDQSADAHLIPGYLIFQINTSLFFANTAQLKDRLRRAEVYGSIRTHPSEDSTVKEPLRFVLFDLSRMPTIDASSLQVLVEIVRGYQARDVSVLVIRLPSHCQDAFDFSGLTARIGDNHIVGSIAEAIEVSKYDDISAPPANNSSIQ